LSFVQPIRSRGPLRGLIVPPLLADSSSSSASSSSPDTPVPRVPFIPLPTMSSGNAPPTATVGATAPKIPMLLPDAFDGSESQYPKVKRQVKTLVMVNKAHFIDDVSKILCASSFMKTGRASLWINAIVDELLDGKVKTWDDFWKEANATFYLPSVKADATHQLTMLIQGKTTAADFFTKFNLLADLAGYGDTAFDHHKITLANACINQALMLNVHATTNDITTWAAYKKRAIILNNNWCIRKMSWSILPPVSTTASSSIPVQKQNTWQPRQQQQNQQQLRQQQQQHSPHFRPGRQGPDSMDTDALHINSSIVAVNANHVERDRAVLRAAGACFYCRQRGHMRSQCPELAAKNNPRQQVGYAPLSRPTNSSVRSQATDIESTPAASVAPSDSISRVVSLTPQYSPPRTVASGSQGFVYGQE
jgi:Retrotransposon gag protein